MFIVDCSALISSVFHFRMDQMRATEHVPLLSSQATSESLQKNIRSLRSVHLCADEYRFSAVIVFAIFFLAGYFLYQVQYKTGIDIIPLFPIDDSGFE